MDRSYLVEESGLSESEYALVSADEESQDGGLSESMGSLNYARPDDLQSLDGTEKTFDTNEEHHSADTTSEHDHNEYGAVHNESEALGQASESQSLQYAEDSLDSPSTPASESAVLDSTPLSKSIVFQENTEGSVCLTKVSVKHTIQEFDEVSATVIVNKLGISEPLPHLAVTLRQTMSAKYLSTREPLRVLYVGNEIAKHDIIYKISSALMASAAYEAATPTPDTGVFTVIPISAFGSPKEIPDVELLKTSASECQIKVEVCTAAGELSTAGGLFPENNMYVITMDKERTYGSTITPTGCLIQPSWTVPHVAIFYVTDHDDETASKTRDAAWKFMTRHSVPSIFIAHSRKWDVQEAEVGVWRNYVDQHSVHLCLESRDSNRVVPHARLPVDLNSFLNIDARQMNRNLAYLTGLEEQSCEVDEKAVKELGNEMATSIRRLRQEVSRALSSSTVRVGFAMGSALLALLCCVLFQMFIGAVVPAAVLGPAADTSACSVTGHAAPLTSVLVSTSTVTINLTSTKTIHIPQVKSTSSGYAVSTYTSLAPEVLSDPGKTVCATEITGANEILLKIPLSTKTSWLAKDSIFIDVYRGADIIKTKFASIDEGILIEIPKKDAYGTLNVLVTTTRRPKVNETFEVDFGKGFIGESIDHGLVVLKDALSWLGESIRMGEEATVGANGEDIAHLLHSTMSSLADLAKEKAVSAKKATTATLDQLRAEIAPTMAELISDLHQVLELRTRIVDDCRDKVRTSVLAAQINAKLWWLKTQNKMEEYDRYKAQAEKYMTTFLPMEQKTVKSFSATKKSKKMAEKARRRNSLSSRWPGQKSQKRKD